MPVADVIDQNNIAENTIKISETASSGEDNSDLDAMLNSFSNQTIEERQAELLEDVIADLDGMLVSDSVTVAPPTPAPSKRSKKATKPATKKVTKRPRKTDVSDKQTLETLRKLESQALEAKACSVANPTPSKSSVSPISTPSIIPMASARSALSAASSKDLPAWDDTGDRVKIAMANRVLAGAGGAAFSLNISESEIALAHVHPKGFTDYFKRRLDRWCVRYLGGKRWFWFAVDISTRGRLHLHGGIEYPAQNIKELENVLCVVGGRDWEKSAKTSDKQVNTKPMWGPDGWVSYDLRNRGAVKKLITGPTFTICRPLRNLARLQYNHARRGNIFWV